MDYICKQREMLLILFIYKILYIYEFLLCFTKNMREDMSGAYFKESKKFFGWKPCTARISLRSREDTTVQGFFLANGKTDNLLKKIREIV